MLAPHLKRRSALSFTNCVLLCKLLIRRMMDYACPVRRNKSALTSGVCMRFHSKCLCVVTLETSTFTRILDLFSPTASLEHEPLVPTQKFSGSETPLVRKLGRYLFQPS